MQIHADKMYIYIYMGESERETEREKKISTLVHIHTYPHRQRYGMPRRREKYTGSSAYDRGGRRKN